jgi:outer membrane protein TolC
MKYWVAIFLIGISLHGFGQSHDLRFYINTARQNSPAIKEFQNSVLSAQIDSQILRATLKPQVAFLSSGSYAPVIGGWGYDEAVTNIANLSGIIQANKSFISTARLGAQLQTIALQRRALLDTIQLSQQDLVRTVTEQYITAYGDQLAADYNREVFELMEREEAILKKLTQASVYKQTDYLTFYVTMQQQELAYLQAQIQYNADYLTLSYLAGLIDTSIQRIEKPELGDSVNSDIYGSVFHQRFITDSLRLANERTLIDFEYKPRLGYYADAGYNSSLQIAPYKNFGFSAGISLTIPLYDGKQKALKYAQLDLRERNRQTNRDFFIAQYRQQSAQLRLQLQATDLLVRKIQLQIDYSRTLITANGKLLAVGEITMKDYITAINNYLTARNVLAQNELSRLRIVNQLQYWNQ